MIVDCHVHFDGVELYDRMIADQRRTGVDQFNIVITPRLSAADDVDRLAAALWFKRRHPDSVYVFGGLDYSGMFDEGRDEPDVPLVEQLDRLMALGCDGLKMLCGKPDSRKEIGQPMDGPLYEPLWAKQQNWWYDSSFPTKQQIDREAFSVFEKHPGLNLILAHFFFLSDDLAAVARFLDAYPGFHVDLAPGVEMLHNFTRRRDEARELFVCYADRILYGTDTGAGRHCTGPKRGWMVRHWLETDDEFDVPDDPLMTPDDRPALKGIALPEDALAKIYAGNFRRIVGAECPRPLAQPAADERIADAGIT